MLLKGIHPSFIQSSLTQLFPIAPKTFHECLGISVLNSVCVCVSLVNSHSVKGSDLKKQKKTGSWTDKGLKRKKNNKEERKERSRCAYAYIKVLSMMAQDK